MPLFGSNINRMKEKKNIEGLIKSLETKKPGIYSEVVEALIELRDVQGLIAVLKKGNYEERSRVLEILGQIGNVEGLVEALRDKDEVIRLKSICLLKGINNVEGIARALEIDDINTQAEAISALESIGGKEAFSAIRRMALKVASELGFEDIEEKETEDTWDTIGGQLLNSNLHVNALACFYQAIEINPQDVRGWGGKALCLVGLTKYEEALKCAEKALEIDHKNLGTRNLLSAIYYNLRQYEKMIQLNTETLEFAPSNIGTRISLGEALACLLKLKEAESELKKALDLIHQQDWMKPEDLAMVHQELGLVAAMRGDKEEAKQQFQQARSDSPRDKWVSELLDSYQILEIMAFAMEGDPLERRNRILNLCEKRSRAKKGQGLSEAELTTAYIYKDSEEPISYWMEGWTEESWLYPPLQGVMLKLWPPQYFTEAVRILPSSRFEAFRKDIEKRILE
jgi:tetratricopeptide (TPR) repeat protein